MSAIRNILVSFVAVAFFSSVCAATPAVSATFNAGEQTFLQGDPAVFQLDLFHPNAWDETPPEPIRIELNNNQSWTNALKATVRRGTNSLTWPLLMLPVTSTTLTLDAEKLGQIFFLLSPADTATFPIGTYSVQFTLDTRSNAAPNAWSGIVRTPRIDLTVEVPAAVSPKQFRRRQLALAQYHLLRGETATAHGALDALLAAQPDDLTALQLKAELLQAAQNFTDALSVTDAALAIFNQANPNPPEPPRDLIRLHSSLSQLLSTTVIRIDSVTASASQLTIHWPGIAGRTYRLESSPTLQTWTTEIPNLLESNGTVTAITTIAPGAKFYRVAMD